MKVIIAGSRHLWNYTAVDEMIAKTDWHITEVVCGMAPGADMVGYAWALINGVPIKPFPADWDRYGKKAGMLRNAEMALYARDGGGLVLLWDGISPGSASMLKLAEFYGLQTAVINAEEL